MGRPARHAHATILDSAKRLSAEVGPQNLTIAAVAARAGAPVGSIYHRYESKDEILAAIWLDLVESFQGRFLATLQTADPVEAGLAAVRFACRWVRRHPLEARLMLVYRRDDFAADRWPKNYRDRAERLAADALEGFRRYASRLLERTPGPTELRAVRFALRDLSVAALARDVEDGIKPSIHEEALLLDTCEFVLRGLRDRARPRRARMQTRKSGGSHVTDTSS